MNLGPCLHIPPTRWRPSPPPRSSGSRCPGRADAKTEGLGKAELGDGVVHALGTFGGLGEPPVPYRNPANREGDVDGSGGVW